jgi:hypothetical protein
MQRERERERERRDKEVRETVLFMEGGTGKAFLSSHGRDNRLAQLMTFDVLLYGNGPQGK